MRLRAVGSSICFLVAPLMWIACGGDSEQPSDPLPPSGDEIRVPFGQNDRWQYRLSDVEGSARPESNAASGPLRALDRVVQRAALSATAAITNERTSAAGGNEEIRRSIGGTRVFGGLTYNMVVDSIGTRADTTYIRQAGADLWLVIDFGTSDDPIETMILDALKATLPWKYAAFGVNSGTTWTIADLDTLVLVEGLPVDLDISLTGENRGLDAVSVPAGQWPNAQRIHVIQDVGISVEGLFRIKQLVRTDAWYVDDVGPVRQDDEGTFEGPGGTGSFATTQELTEYDVE